MCIHRNELAEHTTLFDKGTGLKEGCHEGDLISPNLTEMDQRQLAMWNATWKEYSRNACVHELIAQQASARPDALALAAGDRLLSYRDLNNRANQLARYLQALGVRPGVFVGLCMERSLDMVVGLLGILKAGGAYVPLDPTYPAERLNFMLEDTQTPVLVTQLHLSKGFAVPGIHLVCLDADETLQKQEDLTDPVSGVTVEDLAYIIYTSGSTGQPKGVQVTHASLLNLVFWHQRAFDLTPADRATQLASPAFDATGWELWPYLTLGASVHFPNDDMRVIPEALRDWLMERKITITFLPTALAEQIMALEWPATTPLRFLLTGADTLHTYPSAGLPFALINNYGPTEATVVATSGRVLPVTNPRERPSIGRPIDNTQIYILDEHLHQVPIGETGEIYIGGAGVARGYHNRPELDAQRFIRHPFDSDPQARLYKTGDLGRYLPDGQIAFVGRSDYQIKIRGYRIEPDEIVAAIQRYTPVRECLVVAREDTPGEKRLVAYIVPDPENQLTASDLRETLLAHLPDYMIPALYIRMQALPMMPNGKVDRKALPAPDTANILRDEAVTLPATSTEKRLVEIMVPLIGVQELGIDDNFFMLGGHSLLGVQVIMQVAAAFGVDLTLLTLFEAPTVRQLAAEIERLVRARLETMSDDEIERLLGEQ